MRALAHSIHHDHVGGALGVDIRLKIFCFSQDLIRLNEGVDLLSLFRLLKLSLFSYERALEGPIGPTRPIAHGFYRPSLYHVSQGSNQRFDRANPPAPF